MVQTPRELGFRMPAEWEPHEATWLAWPHNRDTFGDKLPEVEQIFLRMIEELSQNERVRVLVTGPKKEAKARQVVAQTKANQSNVLFHLVSIADVWIRDYGPNFLVGRQGLAFNKWEFNAWGNKYEDLAQDNNVVDKIGALRAIKRFDPSTVLEGGSIDVNGSGVCLTTEQCLLNKNRNPDRSKQQIESCLKNYLNVDKIVWLNKGIQGDDTDGHVDDVARFASKDRVVCAFDEGQDGDNFAALSENFEILKSAGLDVVRLPMPSPVRGPDGPLPASYANFYIANNLVLVPLYSCENDKKALKIIGKCFPGRRVVGIECMPLVLGLGSIHCVTQQQPKVDGQ